LSLMRIVFFGTGEFAVYSLVCIASHHNILLVISGKADSPVGLLCKREGIPLVVPTNPNRDDVIETIREKSPDIQVVIDYGYILKEPLLSIPRLGSIGIHPSLLPKQRGSAPIQRTIMSGEKDTGVTTFLLSGSMDSGDILKSVRTVVGRGESYGEIRRRLSRIGGNILLDSIELVRSGFSASPQQGNPTYAPRIKNEERRLDWGQDAERIKNLVLALSPSPGGWTEFRGKRLIILRARAIQKDTRKPGEIIEGDGLIVSCGRGLIEVLELRPEGKVTMSAHSFCLGYRPSPGERML